MITKAQLENNNFRNLRGDLYYYGTYDYCFNIKTQELFVFNEKNGDMGFLCQITDINKLNDLIGFLN